MISTKIGDTSLEKRVERPLAAVVDPAPSFWPTVLSVAGGITTFLGLLAALYVFHTQYRKPMSWLTGKLRRGKDGPGPRPPEGGYM